MMNEVQQERYDLACTAAAKTVARAIEQGYTKPDWMDDFDALFEEAGAMSLFRQQDIKDLTPVEMAVILCGNFGRVFGELSTNRCEDTIGLAKHVLYALSFSIVAIQIPDNDNWVDDDLSNLEEDPDDETR